MKRITYKKARALITEELDLHTAIEDQVSHEPGVVLVTSGNRVEVCDCSYDLRDLIRRIVDNLRYSTSYTPRVFFVQTDVDVNDIHSALLSDGIMNMILPTSEIPKTMT